VRCRRLGQNEADIPRDLLEWDFKCSTAITEPPVQQRTSAPICQEIEDHDLCRMFPRKPLHPQGCWR
jgi:hypothetical protein